MIDDGIKWWEPVWWVVQRFFEDWVYPAYSLRHFLFDRYDIVRLRDVKRTEYCDVVGRMLYANMELVRHFVEEEHPMEHVVWYRDDDGNDVGHKYGECEKNGFPTMFPEYRGRYIMDIIKEIYNWWLFDYPQLCKEYDYLLEFWCDNVQGKMEFVPSIADGIYEMKFNDGNCPKSLEEMKDVNWGILDKHLDGDRSNVFVKDFVSRKIMEVEAELERQKQKYLHLCIEVRPYLWT